MRRLRSISWFAVIPLFLMLFSGLTCVASANSKDLKTVPVAEIFGFDKGHTEIRFEYDHLAMSKQSGEFRDFDGEIRWDRNDIANSSVNVVIKAASISTGFKPLDDHLKSADFFEVRKYPQIVFRSTKIVQLGTKTGQIIGDLTIRDKTRTITLDVRLNRYYEVHPLANLGARYAGAPYAGFSACAQVLRTDFGVGLYAPGTSNKVDIVIETELRRKH